MRELSVAEQRYQAVLAVISHGETVTDVAARVGVARKTVHSWFELRRLEAPRAPTAGTWVARRASAVGAVCVNWQQVCLGQAAAGRNIDVWVTDQVLQCYDGDQLLRTEKRTNRREVKKKRASVPGGRTIVRTTVTDQPNLICHPSPEACSPQSAPEASG
jgi:hypothetical protein